MDVRLDGKVALVTGSNKGIGKGIAERLAESGADLSITYNSDAAGAEATAARVRELGRRALVTQIDVGDQSQVDTLFARHLTEFGRLDILVNNAGMSIKGPTHELAAADWERVLRTNLHGPFFCSQLAARQMLAQGQSGRIINITSVHEEACWAGDGAYNVSKGGLRNLTRTMANELGPHGITVNAIAPGMILSDMNKQATADPAYREQAAAQIVARRVGMPEDVANMAAFLASDLAGYCTGMTHYVDGGWMLTWPPV
ncbi:MAG: SDR family oxidoreductase [Thermomicrobiales bacterium]